MKLLFKDYEGEFTVSGVESVIAWEDAAQGSGYKVYFTDGCEEFYTAEFCAAEI